MQFAFAVAVFLLVVTLVGHGIWVLVRGAVRLFSASPGADGRRVPHVVLCPECGTTAGSPHGVARCALCNWSPLGDPGSRQLRPDLALDYLRRRVERLARSGLIAPAAADRLVAAVRAEEATLAGATASERATSDQIRWLPSDPVAPAAAARPIESPPKPAAPAARARSYGEFRAAEPVEPAPVADRPHRFFGLLSAFLEEKSIRWGELVGGLLIVGCSLALVITFWSSIAQRPLIKYVLLNGVTASLFGLGVHAERRWKLPTTAVGLLIIATLLTPLNFLAVASLVQGASAPAAWSIVGEATAVLVFAALVLRAGRSLVAGAAWALPAGVVVPSASMLLFSRSIGPDRALPTALALGALPWLAQGLAFGGWTGRFRREREFDEGTAAELLRLLGLGAFAAAVAFGFVLVHAWPVGGLAHRMSPLAPLVGGAILAPGLLLWRRVVAPGLVGYRTAGTAIAAAGVLILAAGVALAWPSPARMVPVAVLDFAVFAAIAVAFRVPAAHGLAGACLGLASLLAWAAAAGRLDWWAASSGRALGVLLSAASGAALVPIALGSGAVAVALARAGRRLDAQAYALVAAAWGLVSLGLVTWRGFGVAGDPAGAAWVYAIYALACPAFAAWWARHPLVAGTTGEAEARGLGWLGSGLLLAALVQGLVFGGRAWPAHLPWLAAVLADATAMVGASLLWKSLGGRRTRGDYPGDDEFAPIAPAGPPGPGLAAEILDRSAVAATSAAALGLAVAVPIGPAGVLAADGCWLAGLALGLAWVFGSPGWFAGAQAALTWGCAFAVAAGLGRRPWFVRSAAPWLDPRTLQAQGLALGLLGLGWIGLRLGVRRRGKALPTLARWLDPPWPTFDRCMRVVVVALPVALAAYAAGPGAAQELTPRDVARRLLADPGPGRVVPPVAAFEVPGVPHAPALGGATWALGGLAIGLLLAGQWERPRRGDLIAALLVATMAAPLAAARWEPAVATASALRWAGAVALLGTSTLIWGRSRLARWADRLGWRLDPARDGELRRAATAAVLALAALPLLAMGLYVAAAAVVGRPLADGLGATWAGAGLLCAILGAIGLAMAGERAWIRSLLGALGALPLLAVTSFVVVTAVQGNPMVGPDPGSFFRRVGQAGSFVPPILLVAATLVGYAVRERSSGFAFAAGLAWNVTATVGFLTLAARAGLRLDAALVVRLAQLNAAVAAGAALAWVAALAARRRRRPIGDAPANDLLMATVALGVTLNLVVLLGGTVVLFLDPIPRPAHPLVAGPLGYLALATAAAAVVARARLIGVRVALDWYGCGLLGLVVLLALGLAGRAPGTWLAYHAMILGLAAFGLAAPAVARWHAAWAGAAVAAEARAVAERWSVAALGLVVLFALRGYWSDPQSPWWTVGGLGAMAALAATLAAWAGRPAYLRAACVLANLAATAWWLARPAWGLATGGGPALADLVDVNAIALALPAPLWLAIERHRLRPARPRGAPFHQVAAWWALGLLGLVVAASLGDEALGSPPDAAALPGWLALGATALALGAGLRDDRARAPVAGLYLLGLVAVGWLLASFRLPPDWLAWTGTMVLAAYSVGTSFLWSRRDALRGLADRLGLPRPDRDDPVATAAWLVPANLILAAGVLVLAFGSILAEDMIALRSAAAHAALAECLAIGLLARGARRTRLQVIVLGVGVAGSVAWGWAWVAPGSPTAALDRSAVLLAATLGGAALFGLGLFKLPRSEDDWTRAARLVVPALLGLAAAVLAATFAVELGQRAQGRAVAMSPPATVALGLTLAGAAAAALVAAVVPGRDPLGLSERGRTAYVYGSEACLAGLGAHVKLTLPWLFGGFFIRYWPFLLMGIAFAGVGLSEVFRRQGRRVLAEPLERTGALLPVLPLLAAFWKVPRPGEDVAYFALVGFLYATLALTRSSLGFGALSALAGNGALWSWLARQDDLGLLAHPQLWVVPPSLCVLVGAYLNRDRLGDEELARIRYGAAATIYLASTADILLTGVARAPWLSAVLAGLSILGIFAGILLRVRGFLFLGLGFLALAVFSVVWYAAVDLHQTWLWAASGVLAGVVILAVFAVFEKKRQEVLRVVGDLREWSA